MIANHGVDPARVFAAGHSAGGAQTALLMATWPEVFAAGGTMAGIPFHCTTQYAEVTTCLNPGKNLTPEQWGGFVREAYTGYAGPYPRITIWHGDADGIVNPSNQTELVEQWSNVHGIDATPDVTEMVGMHTREQYHDAGGTPVIETYRVAGAAHGTFVDPEQGCGAEGAYFLDADICAVLHMAQFFGIVDGSASSGTGSGASGAGSSGSGAGPGGGSESCVPGREVLCTCADGSESFKTCADSGDGYGACDCPEAYDDSCDTGCHAAPAPGSRSSWLVGLGALLAAGFISRRRRKARAARIKV
jgi:MYXO-CTERM domain-containing protein